MSDLVNGIEDGQENADPAANLLQVVKQGEPLNRQGRTIIWNNWNLSLAEENPGLSMSQRIESSFIMVSTYQYKLEHLGEFFSQYQTLFRKNALDCPPNHPPMAMDEG